jgi:hypothetical protein
MHLALFGVAALWLPIGLSDALPPTGRDPTFWVPWFLISSIGLLFFVVSAQAPLMQRWYALDPTRGDPYPLYAASNLGSFAGLLSYPLLVEPLLSLRAQSWLWTAIYGMLVLLVLLSGLSLPGRDEGSSRTDSHTEHEPPPSARRVAHWVALGLVPSGLMLSTTTHLTTDIVAVPLLWVAPLGLYLLSFVLAFAARRTPARIATLLAPIFILTAGGLSLSERSPTPLFSASAGLVLLFTVAVALHAELFRLRPAPQHLTRFYLWMSVGGMLGGLFCAILAPVVFDWAYEHPLLMLGAALLVPRASLFPWPRRWTPIRALALPVIALLLSFVVAAESFGADRSIRMAGEILVSVVALACIGRRWGFAVCLVAVLLVNGGWSTITRSALGVRTRSYFGIYRVDPSADGSARELTHGTTMHGRQHLDPALETVPTAYYVPNSGISLVLQNADALVGPGASIGVVGLGAGALVCYGKPGQTWSYFEIDPAVVQIARTRFTFLSLCDPGVRIVLGDARLSLVREPRGSMDILVVDAFSSDAVPIHLLTREALRVYGDVVRPDGLVVFHISNRYLDLSPVVAGLAAEEGWSAAWRRHEPDEEERRLGAVTSEWVTLSRNAETLERLRTRSGAALGWEDLPVEPGFAGWTDDHASLLAAIRWEKLLGK